MISSGSGPTTVLPRSQTYPHIDQVCNKIAQLAAENGFRVPGVEVVLDKYTFRQQPFQQIQYIQSEELDFRLWFARPVTNTIGGLGVMGVNIPTMELYLPANPDEAFYFHYQGDNWAAHRQGFMDSTKRHGPIIDLPFLAFQASASPMGVQPSPVHPLFFSHNPVGGDPHYSGPVSYSYEHTLLMVAGWLETHILPRMK